jgi:hypothetical protein
MTLEDLKARYVFSDENIDSLNIAYNLKKNIINWGSGGYGKSRVVEDYFNQVIKEPFYLLTCGKGLTVDKLFGGTHVKDLLEKGEMNYLIENSFMMHENVVFEELFDSPPEVLEMLKQTLSSGVFSNGNQVFPIKTKFIVANTNKTREEFSKNNNSIKALLERFPLSKEYKWEKHTESTYSKLIETKLGIDYCDKILLEILEECAINKKIISPRIALEAAELVKHCGIECLTLVADFLEQQVIVEKVKIKYAFLEKVSDIRKEANILYAKQKGIDSSDIEGLKEIEQEFRNLLFRATSIPRGDEQAESMKQLENKLSGNINAIVKQIEFQDSLESNLKEMEEFN